MLGEQEQCVELCTRPQDLTHMALFVQPACLMGEMWLGEMMFSSLEVYQSIRKKWYLSIDRNNTLP